MRREVKEALVEFFESEGEVLASYIFGSHARGYATKKSDFDIAILLSETPRSLLNCYLHFINRLTVILGDNVDLVILNTAPPTLKYHVIKYGRIIYSRSELARVAFEARAISEYLDFSIDIRRYDECLMKRIQV